MMHRRELPPLATWTLEHLTSGERDEALAGDLLEQFRMGRTDHWYWSQVIAALLVSWSRSLTGRGPALAFALVWCVIAPAWQAIIDGIEKHLPFDALGSFPGPLLLILIPATWIVLHAAFLWVGLLIYQSAHALLRTPIRQRELRRAFWLSTLILPPAVFVTFVVANLYWYTLPGLAHAKLAASFADLSVLPNLIRIPYFVALLSALWGTTAPPVRRQELLMPDRLPNGAEDASDAMARTSTSDGFAITRFLAFMAGAGLVNATTASFLLGMLSDPVALRLGPLVIRAFFFVAVCVLAGVIGAYVYWQNPWSPFRDQPPLPFPLFAFVCAAGWVWVPAMVLFSEALSADAAFVAMTGAFVLTMGLRSATFSILAPVCAGPSDGASREANLFEESLYRTPIDPTGYAIAIGIFLAIAALVSRWISTAAALLALSAAVFVWRWTIPRRSAFDRQNEFRKAARRVALVFIPAILITAWALFDNTLYRYRMAQADAMSSKQSGGIAQKTTGLKSKRQTIGYGSGGYESLILWPYPEKKQMVIIPDSLLAPGIKRPLMIRFDGPYLYVQPPYKAPGLDSHQTNGSPVDVEIASNNAVPVVMTARQSLVTPIRIALCREIEVDLENRDNVPGPISLALLLTEAEHDKQTLYLGQEPIVSAEPQHFSFKTKPVFETLRFPVPANPGMRQFSEITVLMLPDIQHRFIAPRIAIKDFLLLPR